MKLSTRTRYSTRLMFELALGYGSGPILLKDIAKREDISEKYLSQIVIPLKAVGLIHAFRGAHGGYELSRPPGQITLKEIVEIFEGGIELVHCETNKGMCDRYPKCITTDIWKELSKKMGDYLNNITLTDLVEKSKNKQNGPLSYDI